jgi:putative endonuclease
LRAQRSNPASLAHASAAEIASSAFGLLAMTLLALSLRAKRSNLMAMPKQYFVYILTNKHHTVLYTGVTSDLQKRVYQHRMKMVPGFTGRYNVSKLVYYEVADNPEAAIVREKQIKAGSRQKKIDLINAINPQRQDLYETL